MSQAPRKQGHEVASTEAAPKPRRALAEGPAFQAALAELENESSGGWKLLDGPPAAKPKPTGISGPRPVVKPAAAPPPPPRRDLNRTQVMAKPPEVAKPAVVVAKPPEVVAKPPEVVAKPPEVVAKPPEPAANAFASTVMAAFAETVPRAPQPSSEPVVVAPPPAPVVATPSVAIESASPPPVAEAPVVVAERIGAASAMMELPADPLPRLAPPPSRRKWVVVVAGVGVVSGVLAGLAVLGAVLSRAPTQEKPSTPVAAPVKPAPAPAADSAPAPAADSAAAVAQDSAPATLQPSSHQQPGGVPWSDQPQTDSGSCKELAAAAPRSLTVELAIKSAHRSMMRGDAKAAHEAFCVATEKGAQTQTVLMGHAHALLMQSDYAAALQVVDRELQLRPSPAARLLRGDVLIRTGDVEEAKRAWLSAAGVSPDSQPLVQNLRKGYETEAQAALRAGDLARADRTLRRVRD